MIYIFEILNINVFEYRYTILRILYKDYINVFVLDVFLIFIFVSDELR